MANTITIIILPSQKYLHINLSQTRKRARSQKVVGQRCGTSHHETMSPPSTPVCGNHPEMDLCCGPTMTVHLTHTQLSTSATSCLLGEWYGAQRTKTSFFFTLDTWCRSYSHLVGNSWPWKILGKLVLLKQNKYNYLNVFFTFGSGALSFESCHSLVFKGL